MVLLVDLKLEMDQQLSRLLKLLFDDGKGRTEPGRKSDGRDR
jgi:hypothetical protein